MRTITCPRCGSTITLRTSFNLTGKPFCVRCGWNLQKAEAALAGKSALIKFLPLGVAAIVLVFIFISAQAHTPAVFFIPAVFLLVIFFPLIGYYSAQKAIAAAKFAVNPDLALSQPPLDPQLQILQSIPRPRRVKFRLAGNFAPVVIVFAAIGLLSAIVFVTVSRAPLHSNRDFFAPFFPLLFVMFVFAAAFLIPFFRDKRNLPLLRDGELAFARVTSQRTVQQGKASYSSIDYEFKISSGLQIRGTARDLTNSVFEDMTIPVFYDPLNPDKNITPCATYLKVSTDPL